MDESSKVKKNSKSKFIISFLLFFFIGGLIGGFGTYKTLGMKDKEVEEKEVKKEKKVETPKEIDITKDPDYTDMINSLYGYLSKDNIFYSSVGVDLATMSNDNKLRITYEYMMNNNLFATDTLNPMYYGALSCTNNFSLDVIVGADGSLSNGSVCTINKISLENFVNTYKKVFNDETIDVSQPFNPKNNRTCVISDEYYVCGNVNTNNSITGSLDSKFEIVKVIKEDKKVTIYDKGYLVDTRSSVVNPDDGYDNYYLHSSDSTTYYYELKSADNLTFAHTFILGDDSVYRYAGTAVVQN